MDDNGMLRKPTWIRSFDAATRLANARVKDRYKKTFDQPIDAEVKKWVDSYQRGSVLVIGPPDAGGGRGQGDVARSEEAANAIHRVITQHGESGRWINASDYIKLYKDEWDNDDQGRLWRELKYLAKGYDVLALDGLGEEPDTIFGKGILADLVRERVEAGCSLIVTTCLNRLELAGHYTSRVGTYLSEGSYVAV